MSRVRGGVCDGVTVLVRVGVAVSVLLDVGVGVGVGEAVRVRVGVAVLVLVGVVVIVGEVVGIPGSSGGYKWFWGTSCRMVLLYLQYNRISALPVASK